MQGELFAKKRKSKDINRVFVIIPAAGSSERMGAGTDKLFMEVAGKPVIERTLDAFAAFTKDLEKSQITLKAIIVASKNNNFQIQKLVKSNNYAFVHSVILGGNSRTQSVWKGLEELDNMPIPPRDNDIVFIHDGARCLVSQEVLDNCLEGILYNDICAPAVPAKNTIKKIETEEPEAAAVESAPEPEPATAPEPENTPEEPKTPLGFVGLRPLGARPGSAASTETSPKFEDNTSSGFGAKRNPLTKKTVGFDKSAILFNPSEGLTSSRSLNKETPSASSEATKAAPASAPAAASSAARNASRAARPMKPQIKVESTPNRAELMEVQTPQVFRYIKLINSYANAIRNNLTGTDDTELAEKLNYKVTLVEGSYSNIKITTPEDIAMAEAIVKEQEKEAAE